MIPHNVGSHDFPKVVVRDEVYVPPLGRSIVKPAIALSDRML